MLKISRRIWNRRYQLSKGLGHEAWDLGPEHFVLVLTTFPADRDADHFARTLVEERLAACVNVLPAMRSIYSWKGEIENSEERQLIIKTSKTQVAPLQARFHDLHPYELPEFLVIPIDDGSPAYFAWLSKNTSR